MMLGSTPLVMVSLRSMRKASSATVRAGVGDSTMPSVLLVDFSGASSVLPPLMMANCVEQSVRPPGGGTTGGQRSGSDRPGTVTPVVCGRYRSCRLGARKPLPTAARSTTCGSGCQRALSLGVVELPTPS